MKHRFIITGTGRCGTGFLAETLRMNGLLCSHEKVFTENGFKGWYSYEADSSWLAAPYLHFWKDLYWAHLPLAYGVSLTHSVKVVHLIREPDPTIESLARELFGRETAFQTYARRALPRLPEAPLEAARVFYDEWNALIAPWADYTLCLELITPERLSEIFGVHIETLAPVTTNHRPVES